MRIYMITLETYVTLIKEGSEMLIISMFNYNLTEKI